ncbi:BA14K family protein [Rhizobium daejeonense]|uniref:Lectin-like protein BA14k n=1 Tax=Rhizobium daejeonense TaxID=240521 RepID=A0A6M1RTB9_9HYPH|nr:BA14K family protein [Rhizobium daejeonense]NGO64934.1 BA14K family protein [Rhizobium daejeonense]
MIRLFGKILLGAQLGLVGLSSVAAQAAMPMTEVAPAAAERSGVVKVQTYCDAYGCYETRRPPGYRPPPPPPGWDDGYRRPPPPRWDDDYRRPRPPGWDDGYYRRPPPPPPPPVYRRPPPPPPGYGMPQGRNWGNHVRWCLDRYQSYNPQTNRFLSSSGYFKVCRSPYY